MYCKNCGKEISDNSKFCQQCGTKLEAETAIHSFSFIPINAVSYAVISFCLTIMLFFPAWLTVNLPTALQTLGLPTSFAYSPMSLIDLFDKLTQLGQITEGESELFFKIIVVISWEVICMVLLHLGIMFENIYHHKKTRYFEGEFISLICFIFSIAFIIATFFLNNKMTNATYSYEIIKISPTICPFLIFILNTTAFIWLIIEEHHLPEEYDDEVGEEEDY